MEILNEVMDNEAVAVLKENGRLDDEIIPILIQNFNTLVKFHQNYLRNKFL